MKVGINGFGRIGRNFSYAAKKYGAGVDMVAADELTSAEMPAHLLEHDSVHGKYPGSVEVVEQ